MVKKIEGDNWIKIHLGISSTATGLIKNKNLMKEYAEELGWEIETDKEGSVDENGIRYYSIDVIPNKSRKISPENLRELKDKLVGFAYDLWSSIHETEEGVEFSVYPVVEDITAVKKADKLKGQIVYGDVLFIEYPIVKRLELERESANMSNFIFEESLYDYFERITIKIPFYKKPFKKELVNELDKYLKQLDQLFGIKLIR